MKEKIFQALKTEYARLGLGDEILSKQASLIEGMGVVTDENLATIIAAQKEYLEGMQKFNDKRVSEALAKAQQKAADELKAKLAETKKANDDALAKAIAEIQAKYEGRGGNGDKGGNGDGNGGETEAIKSLREQYEKSFADSSAQVKAMQDKLEEMMKGFKTQSETLAKFQKENEAMKAAKAAEERKAFIENTAKELGIPSWRIGEGFNISSEMDNEAIKAHLTTVATNIKQAGIMPNGGVSLDTGGSKPTDAEIDSLIKI